MKEQLSNKYWAPMCKGLLLSCHIDGVMNNDIIFWKINSDILSTVFIEKHPESTHVKKILAVS